MKIISLSLLLIWGTSILLGQEPAMRNAVASLVEAERSFAAASLEDGMKKAFLTFLADDALVFRPGPLNGKSIWGKRKESTDRLEWYPTVAFVSASGELGYTSGPSIYTPEAHLDQPPRYGYFVSMWKKQQEGNWKVALDLGTMTDAPSSPDTSLYVPESFPNVSANPATERSNVLKAEKNFSKVASSTGIQSAFRKFLLDDGRVYRPEKFPAQGRDAVLALFGEKPSKVRSTVTACTVSNSGDLAYTHGAYTSSEPGYFVRIWRKVSPGNWKLAIDIISPIPKEK